MSSKFASGGSEIKNIRLHFPSHHPAYIMNSFSRSFQSITSFRCTALEIWVTLSYICFSTRAFRVRVEQTPLLDRTRTESSPLKASARSKFSSSSRAKGSARSNSKFSSFEQEIPVRCSTRTRLDSTRKPSLSGGIPLGVLEIQWHCPHRRYRQFLRISDSAFRTRNRNPPPSVQTVRKP